MGRSTIVASFIFFGSLMLGGSACTDADGAILVLQNQVPEDGCLIHNTIDTFMPRGAIDTNAEAGYVFNPLVQNSAVNTDSQDRVAIIEGAEINITLQEGLLEPSDQVTALTSFTARFSGAVQGDGGLTSFSFVAIPKELLNLIAPMIADGVATEVKVEATVFGKVSGGNVESNKFAFWVDVCNGCMKVDQGACTALNASYTPRKGGTCNLLQDVKLDCCSDAAGTEVCPAEPVEDDPQN